MARRREARERGATVVEFAIVFPLLALLFAALADLGFVVLGSSVASGAAREGARVGLIHYLDADNGSSANHGLIQAAVNAKLLGWIKPGSGVYVAVRCLDGDNLATVKPCDDAIEIDKDVVEVTVNWEALAATGLLPVDRTQTDTARMVITGGNESSVGGSPPPGGSTINFAPTTYTTTETDAPSTVTLTVTRTNSTGTASVTVTTTAGTATATSDFLTFANTVNFPAGQLSVSFAIGIVGDDISESTESFTAQLSNPIGGTLGGSTLATVTINDDDSPADTTAPVLASPLEMRDINTNGRVDQVIARFNETLGACNAAGAWTLAFAPSGATLASVSISGMVATLTLTEGAGAQNTAVGAFTLALSAASAGICDPAGNRASFAATAPADFAGPVLLTVSDTNGATDGLPENNDTMTLTFSEALLAGSIPATATVTVDNTGSGDQVSIPGVVSPIALNGDYINPDVKVVTFASSTVVLAGGSKQVVVTLKNAAGDVAKLNAATSSPNPTVIPAASITDPTGRAAAGSTQFSIPPAAPPATFKVF